jgi:hypothetical protein
LQGIWQTWQHVVRARAAENLLYVIVPQKFLVNGPAGAVAFIAGPEALIARATRPGLLVADLDFDRLSWLRSRLNDRELLLPPDTEDFQACATQSGYHRCRRPELYGPIVEPQPGAYDFRYVRRSTGTHAEEEARPWISEEVS